MEALSELMHQNIILSKTRTGIEVIVTEGGADNNNSIFSRTSIFHFRRKAETTSDGRFIINCKIIDLEGEEREKFYFNDQELINAFGAFIGKNIWGDIIYNTQQQDKE